MTDNEIIKALENCKGYLTNECTICQNVEKYPRCNEFLNEIALVLINRQKAEIKRLQKNIDGLNIFTTNHMKIIRLQAMKEFAERLKEKFGIADCIVTVNNNDIDDLVEEMMEVNEK